LLEPALQGPFGRDGLAGVAVVQDDAQEAGAPAGVLPAQVEGGLVQGVPRAFLLAGRRSVGGTQRLGVVGRVLAVAAKAAQQVTYRAGGQAQGAGDRRRGLPLAGTPQDGLAQGLWSRCRHNAPRKEKNGDRERGLLAF
jgi:hypothetical protein